MGSVEWGPDVAAAYDRTSEAMFDPAVLDPTVDVLAGLAGGGAALEFAVGTGRVALRRPSGGFPRRVDDPGDFPRWNPARKVSAM